MEFTRFGVAPTFTVVGGETTMQTGSRVQDIFLLRPFYSPKGGSEGL